MTDQGVIHAATIAATVLALWAATAAARGGANSSSNRWWVPVGAYAVALAIVGVAYTLATTRYYWGY